MTATLPPEVSTVEATQKRWAKWMLYLGFVGFLLGLLMGGLQAMDRADFYLYDDFLLANYYQGLTLHGVSMAFILTFAFANSFLTLSVMRGFKRPMASTALIQGSFWLALGRGGAGAGRRSCSTGPRCSTPSTRRWRRRCSSTSGRCCWSSRPGWCS